MQERYLSALWLDKIVTCDGKKTDFIFRVQEWLSETTKCKCSNLFAHSLAGILQCSSWGRTLSGNNIPSFDSVHILLGVAVLFYTSHLYINGRTSQSLIVSEHCSCIDLGVFEAFEAFDPDFNRQNLYLRSLVRKLSGDNWHASRRQYAVKTVFTK